MFVSFRGENRASRLSIGKHGNYRVISIRPTFVLDFEKCLEASSFFLAFQLAAPDVLHFDLGKRRLFAHIFAFDFRLGIGKVAFGIVVEESFDAFTNVFIFAKNESLLAEVG